MKLNICIEKRKKEQDTDRKKTGNKEQEMKWLGGGRVLE